MDEVLDSPEVTGALVDLALQGHHLQVQRRHLVRHVLLYEQRHAIHKNVSLCLLTLFT